MKKRIILVGKGASGKDHTRKQLEELGLTYATSYTSRPARPTEVEAKDYYFLSQEKFESLLPQDEEGNVIKNEENIASSDFFFEAIQFNGSWWYGTSNKQFDTLPLFIMTPSGLNHVKDQNREESIVIYFDIDEETRRSRLNERADADKTERRLQTDREDFSGYTNFDIRITNPQFTFEDVINAITDISHDVFEASNIFISSTKS